MPYHGGGDNGLHSPGRNNGRPEGKLQTNKIFDGIFGQSSIKEKLYGTGGFVSFFYQPASQSDFLKKEIPNPVVGDDAEMADFLVQGQQWSSD